MAIDILLNPYIVGNAVKDPRMFFGRRDIFEFIRENLPGRYQNNIVVLQGQTRVGKTSVLLQMDHYLGDTHIPVLIDFQVMSRCDLDSLLAEIRNRITGALKSKGIALPQLLSETDGNELRTYFRESYLPAVLAAIGDSHLLLMFDETPLLFERGLEQEIDEVLPYFKHLVQFYPQLDLLFTAGSAPKVQWEATFNRYLGAAARKKITFLTREDAVALITEPVANSICYSKAAIEKILVLAGGHPYFLQLICHCLFNQCLDKQKCSIDASDVHAIIDEAIEMGELNLEDMWRRSSAAEQVCLALLASTMNKHSSSSVAVEELDEIGRSFGWDKHDAPLRPAIEKLGQRDIISLSAPYRFHVDVFRYWLIQNDKPGILRQKANFDAMKQKYLDHVKTTCGWLDFRGILQVQKSMFQPLLDVFVPLRVVSEKWSSAIIEEFMRRARAKRFLEELELFSAAEVEVRQAIEEELRLLAPLSQQDRPRMPFIEIMKDSLHLVVLGDPGSGKTTLLKYLALIYAHGQSCVQERLGLEEDRLPIFVSLGIYAGALRRNPSLSLEDFLPEHFSQADSDLPPKLGWLLADEVHAGRCLLLLDGLDEAADNVERRLIAEKVRDLARVHPGNRLVVTSRVMGYEEAPLGEEYSHCTLSGLEIQDIEQFARQWSKAYERQQGDSPLIDRRAEVEAAKLFAAIQENPNVRQLAENPLLLTIIALIHRKGTKLPGHRIELYALCIKTLIETWHEARTVPAISPGKRIDEKEAMKIFAPIALWMQEEKPVGTVSAQELEDQIAELLIHRYVPPEEARSEAHRFLDMEELLTGLLVKRGRDSYSFSHRTFQEYFAARAITMHRDEQLHKLQQYRHDPRWREVILLTIGQLGIIQTEEETATRQVQRFLDEPAPLDDVLHRDLLLAGRCLADDVGVSYPLQRRILQDLLHQWLTTPFDWLKRQIGDTLASMRLATVEGDVVQALIENLDHPDELTRAMAAEALGNMGKVSTDVTQHLLRVLRDPRPRVRSNVAWAIGQIGVVMPEVTEQLDAVLKRDDELDVRRSAAAALVKLGEENREALAVLLTALHFRADPNVRGSAAAALTHLKSADDEVITSLVAALGDPRLDVRSHAAEALGKLGRGSSSSAAVSKLVGLLNDPRLEARTSAALALGELEVTDTVVIEALINCLKDSEYSVRRNTIWVLGKLGRVSEGVVSVLSQALTDDDPRTRVGAANALGQAGRAGEEVLVKMQAQLMQERDWLDRLGAIEAVVSVDVRGDAGMLVVDNLLQILSPEFHHMGWEALGIVASLFGEVAKRNAKVVESLIALLKPDQPRLVRVCVAEALGIAGWTDQEVTDALLEAMNDEVDFVRGNAVQALARLSMADDKTISQLLLALEDRIPGVQVSAAEALGKLGNRSEQVVNALVNKLDDEGSSYYHEKQVRDAAFEALQVLAPYGITA